MAHQSSNPRPPRPRGTNPLTTLRTPTHSAPTKLTSFPPAPQAGRIFLEWAQLPLTYPEFLAKQAIHQRALFPSTKPLPGVPALLHTLHSGTSPAVHMALATSSQRNNFEYKTSHLGQLFGVFADERRVLGDDPRIPHGRGKPAPDIYLLALRTINEGVAREGKERPVAPEECLVFEDSVPGVEAGRRAGMRVVWCPHPELLAEYRGREGEVLAGRTGLREREEGGEGMEGREGQRVAGWPGEVDDGWAELLESLKEFPYERYGIKVVEKG